jgi:sporulation protein YlmC with PRC-barrel domain
MSIHVRNYEEDNRTGVNHEGPHANTPIRRLAATSIIGDEVESITGEVLGKIDDIMININDSEVEYVVMEYGAFFGIGGKLFAIPFGELKVNPNRKCFMLHRDKEYLRNAPGFDRLHWPDTNDHPYFREVGRYYKTPVPPISW